LRQKSISDEVVKAAQNASSLLELNEKDPSLAEEVAKRFGYSSFEEARATIVHQSPNKEESEEERFNQMYQKRKAQEEHELALSKIKEKINKISDESNRNQVQNYFDKISKGRTLDIELATEFMEMATLYVSKDKLKEEKL